MNKVQIMPDELGNVVRQSKNNTDFGYVRLQQDKVSFGNNGWVKRSQVSTLLHGKIEDFDAIGIKDKTELTGKIIVREQTEAFSANDPDRDLKYAGDTGVICCAYGEPIYRKTFFVTDVNAEDLLIAHTNGDAIREANGFTTPQVEVKETAEEVVTEDDNENEDLEEEMVEETVDELDDSFEL